MDLKNKKILFISYDGMTDPLGQSQVIPYLRELTKLGCQFTLLSVEKASRLVTTGELIKRQLREAGISWETITYTKYPPIISKIYDQKRLNKKAALLHKEKSFDLIHCRSYVAAEAGARLNIKTGVPFLFDIRGFWVDERVDSGLWNRKNPLYNFLYKLYKGKEKKFFEKATHIISLTEKGKIELNETYQVPKELVTVIPCCADIGHFNYHLITDSQKSDIRKQLAIPQDVKLLSYLGSLGGWYLTSEMMDFFIMLHTRIPNSMFLFITPDSKEEILKLAIQKGIDPAFIRIYAAQRAEVPLYLSISNWNVFFIKDAYSKKASSPTKQAEVMAMGIPLICNDIGDTGKIVENSRSGLMVREFSDKEYERVIDELVQFDESDKTRIRDAAIKNFDLQSGAIRYSEVYRKILV